MEIAQFTFFAFSFVLFLLKQGIRRWLWKRTKAEEVIKGGEKFSIKKNGNIYYVSPHYFWGL